MARTTFSGPVKSNNGFEGNITGNVTGNVTGSVAGAVAATTLSASDDATLSGTANVIIIPTVDPAVAGAIWYDVDTLKVSTGA
jgi:hypothetical protein